MELVIANLNQRQFCQTIKYTGNSRGTGVINKYKGYTFRKISRIYIGKL